jgi:hypothetical protein
VDDFHAGCPVTPSGDGDHPAECASRQEAPSHGGWWSRLVRKLREVGPAYAALLIVRAVIPAWFLGFARMVVLELRLRATERSTVRGDGIRWAGPEDCHELQTLGHPIEVLRRRFADGSRVCVLSGDDGVLAYVWFEARHHDEADLRVRFTLGAGELWLYDAMVRADQRGRGLYPRLLSAAARNLGDEGVRRVLIAIDMGNRNSIRAHRAAGARPVGAVCAVHILGFTIVRDPRGLRMAWVNPHAQLTLPTSRLATELIDRSPAGTG